LRSVLASICRIRSRVTENCFPTSSKPLYPPVYTGDAVTGGKGQSMKTEPPAEAII
jgi:hypothetical protein